MMLKKLREMTRWTRIYGDKLDLRNSKTERRFSFPSGSIWGIAILVHLIAFWFAKDLVMFRYGDGAFERLRRTFFTFELVRSEEGPDGQTTHEYFYTVPTRMVETSTRLEEPPPQAAVNTESLASILPKPEEPKISTQVGGVVRIRGMQFNPRRIVFLIDASGSMWNSVDGKSKKTRFDLAREEVLKGVEQLAPDVDFNIVYFADGIVRLSDTPMYATEASKLKAQAFLKETPALSGGTEFLQGLQEALEMKPDSLLVISDGFSNEPNWKLTRQFKELYKSVGSDVPIYSIGLAPPSEKDQNQLLENLARSTGGLFVPIPVSENQKVKPTPTTTPTVAPKSRRLAN